MATTYHELHIYEIWSGYHHAWGQGDDDATEPRLLDTKALGTSHEDAIAIYALEHPWPGNYYPTKEEAWLSFPEHLRPIPYLEDAKRILKKCTMISGDMSEEEFYETEQDMLQKTPKMYEQLAVEIKIGIDKGYSVEVQEKLIVGVLEAATKAEEKRIAEERREIEQISKLLGLK